VERLAEKPNCDDCRALHQRQSKTPPCEDCIPPIMPENELLLQIYNTSRGPDGSLDLSVVLRVLDLHNISERDAVLGYLTSIKSLHAYTVQLAKDKADQQ
jgi:hypothetical protein